MTVLNQIREPLCCSQTHLIQEVAALTTSPSAAQYPAHVTSTNPSHPARASGDAHKSYDDVAASEEVEVVDACHPLYGRRYRLISIGKESTTRGACKES